MTSFTTSFRSAIGRFVRGLVSRATGWSRQVLGNRFDRPAGLIAATVVLLALAELPNPLRVVALPAALFVPGHLVVTLIFGPSRAPVGLTGAGLRVIMSMAAYPLLALGIFIADRFYTRTSVLIAVLALGVISAFVGLTREYRHGEAVTGPPVGIDRAWMSRAMMPVGSLVCAFLIVAVGVEVAPRRPIDEFVQFNLGGRWALVDAAVPIAAGFEPAIETEISNRTTEVRRYEVVAYVGGRDDAVDRWEPVRIEVAPGETAEVRVEGPIPDLGCRTKVEIVLNDLDGPDEHDPLALFFRAAERSDC